MLDIKLLRQDPEAVTAALAKRGGSFAIDQVLEEDGKRRALVYEMEQLRAEQNVASDAIGAAKKAKQDASEAIAAMKTIKDRIAVLEEQVREVDATLADLLLGIPNLPDESLPVGKDEASNREERKWGEVPTFDFEPKDHVALGESLAFSTSSAPPN